MDSNLPHLQIGSGDPKILITAVIHGDEITGVFVLQKLREMMGAKLTGTVGIMPVLNVEGMKRKVRVNPKDNVDMNRIFFRNDIKTSSGEIVSELKDIIAQYDYVLDLHVFRTRKSITTGIQFLDNNESLNGETSSMLKALHVPSIWQLGTESSESDKAGTMVQYALSLGKPAVAIEYNAHQFVDEAYIVDQAENLQNLLKSLKILDGDSKKHEGSIPLIERHNQLAASSGVFCGKVELGTQVKSGDYIGDLIDLRTLNPTQVFADNSGKLISLAYNHAIFEGDKLFTVAKKIGEI